MSAETDLKKLLASMKPKIHPGVFVFTTVSPAEIKDIQKHAIAWFREEEGITLILEEDKAASHNIDYIYPSSMITLMVHSSLDAVGFLAVIANKLAAEGISVNAISAYYHDHLFVPLMRAEQALAILNKITDEAAGKTYEN
jgi:hypothetical protein